jgi:hypothetical protein
VELEIPAGVTVTEVVAGSNYTFETRREGDRIVAITWKQDIPPRARGEFMFVATRVPQGQSPGRLGSTSLMERARIGSASKGTDGRRRSPLSQQLVDRSWI